MINIVSYLTGFYMVRIFLEMKFSTGFKKFSLNNKDLKMNLVKKPCIME